MEPIITSMLDTDCYKLTQQAMICKLYPRARAKYAFINRDNTPFPSGFAALLREQVEHLSILRLTEEEAEFLRQACPYLDPVYIDFLLGFKFDPDEVHISQSDNDLSVFIEGLMYRAMAYEVMMLAIKSELYFKTAKNIEMLEDHIGSPIDAKRDAKAKSRKMAEAGAVFADFGTRRRYSHVTQERVIQGLQEGGNTFIGTSNPYFAMKFGLTPIGTIAHESVMALSVLRGLRHANQFTMEDWISVYQGNLGIMLTDTFGTEAFFEDFTLKYAQLFQGVRHDSGDPIEFGERTIQHYEKLKIDPLSKTIVFSDGLNVDEAIRIKRHFDGKVKTSFGIGTSLTNSIGCKPLNMVIKLVEIDGTPVVKLSDVPGKETGDPKAIEYAKWTFGL